MIQYMIQPPAISSFEIVILIRNSYDGAYAYSVNYVKHGWIDAC